MSFGGAQTTGVARAVLEAPSAEHDASTLARPLLLPPSSAEHDASTLVHPPLLPPSSAAAAASASAPSSATAAAVSTSAPSSASAPSSERGRWVGGWLSSLSCDDQQTHAQPWRSHAQCAVDVGQRLHAGAPRRGRLACASQRGCDAAEHGKAPEHPQCGEPGPKPACLKLRAAPWNPRAPPHPHTHSRTHLP